MARLSEVLDSNKFHILLQIIQIVVFHLHCVYNFRYHISPRYIFFLPCIGVRAFSFSFYSLFKLLHFIEAQLIYSIVLVSGRWHSDWFIHVYLFFFRFFSLIGY